MSTPIVSIIVPVYNVGMYLERCLDSLVNQTQRDIEIICVDDGSTDNCATILAAYAEQDERIRVITQANAGLGAARNRGLDAVSSPYIMFCDSDDWYELSMCEKMLAAIESNEQADVAICGYQSEWERHKEVDEHEAWGEDVPFNGFHILTHTVLRSCLVGAPFKIYRRELIDREHIRFSEGVRYEDVCFWYPYMAHARGIVFVSERLYHYRMRAGSITHDAYMKNPAASTDYVLVAEQMWNYFKKNHLLDIWEGYIAELWGLMVIFALRFSRGTETQKQVLQSVREFVIRESETQSGKISYLLLTGLVSALDRRVFKKKRLWGLLKTRYSLYKITVRLCGIALYKVRYQSDRIRWFIMGMPCRTLYAGDEQTSKEVLLRTYYALFYEPLLPYINDTFSLSISLSPDSQEFLVS